MVRICKNCGFENQDSYDFCAKCGTPLVEGLQPNTFFVYRNVEQGIAALKIAELEESNPAVLSSYNRRSARQKIKCQFRLRLPENKLEAERRLPGQLDKPAANAAAGSGRGSSEDLC